MARAMDLDFLYAIPHYFVYLALLAWTVVFAGLVDALIAPLLASWKRQRDT
jgi:hypothetical protein